MEALKHTWQNVAELAADLCAAYPETDPLRLAPDAIRSHVLSLKSFADDPQGATRERLEEIQSAWYDVREDV